MRIGITQRIVENQSYKDVRDALSQDWCEFLYNLYPDAIVLPVPNFPEKALNWIEEIMPDLIILSNGNDIGECKRRDLTEEILLRYAISKNTPVLGVCRGFQFVNHYFGGELTTSLSDITNLKHVAEEHIVSITAEQFMALAEQSAIYVNSYHNQGVTSNGLADCLQEFAIASDEVVEGYVHKEFPILCIQWHPERHNKSEKFNQLIVTNLVKHGLFWN